MTTNDRQNGPLDGRVVVIAGGTGGVGEGIVRAYLERGATVVVPSRSEGKVDGLREVLGEAGGSARLHFLVQDYSTFADAETLADDVVAKFGRVDDVVASIGGWWAGKPLWQISEQDWKSIFIDFSTSHVAMLRAFLPRLGVSGAYTLILGGSATTPVPGSAIVNMEQAALLMMRSVVQLEAGDQRRIFGLVMGPIMTRMRHRGDPDWVTADQVGEIAASLSARPSVRGRDFSLRGQADVESARRVAAGEVARG